MMCNLANAFKCISYVIQYVFLVDFRNLGARIWESGGQKIVKLQSVLAVYLCLSVMKGLAVWNLSSTCHNLTRQCSNQNKRKRGGKACYFTLKKVCGTRPSIKQFPLPLPVIQSIFPLNNIVRHQNLMTCNSAHSNKLGLSD